MGRLEFIKRLFDFFQIKDDSKGVLLENYDIALSVDYKVDWDNLYFHIIRTAERNLRPMPKAILELMPQFRKRDMYESENEGDTIIVSFLNGMRYDFMVCTSAETSIKDILARNWKQLADGSFINRIKKIVQIPKGICVLSGSNKVFFNDDIPPEEQKMLKSKIRILWNNEKAKYMKGAEAV